MKLAQRIHRSRLQRRFSKAVRRCFPAAFYINLDHRPDRRATFEAQLERFDLVGFVKRFPAVYLKDGPHAAHERLQHGKYSILSCAGVMLSHRTIVQRAKQEGLSSVLIFEDDACIQESALGGVCAALKDLRQREWKAFYLGATYNRPLERVTKHLLRAPHGAHANHAMAYHSRIYDQVLETLPEDPLEWINAHRYPVDAIDVWLQETGVLTGEVYCCDPIAAVQGDSSSDISTIEDFDIARFQIDHFERFRPAD